MTNIKKKVKGWPGFRGDPRNVPQIMDSCFTGMSISKACEETGIPRATLQRQQKAFRKLIFENPIFQNIVLTLLTIDIDKNRRIPLADLNPLVELPLELHRDGQKVFFDAMRSCLFKCPVSGNIKDLHKTYFTYSNCERYSTFRSKLRDGARSYGVFRSLILAKERCKSCPFRRPDIEVFKVANPFFNRPRHVSFVADVLGYFANRQVRDVDHFPFYYINALITSMHAEYLVVMTQHGLSEDEIFDISNKMQSYLGFYISTTILYPIDGFAKI